MPKSAAAAAAAAAAAPGHSVESRPAPHASGFIDIAQGEGGLSRHFLAAVAGAQVMFKP
jgi:hypothetical protein